MDKKMKKVKGKEEERKENEKKELAVARGEVTPPATPRKRKK